MAPSAILALPSLPCHTSPSTTTASIIRASSSSFMARHHLRKHPSASLGLTMQRPSSESSQKTAYKDSWLDKACMDFLAGRITKEIGLDSDLQGYDRLVDITRKAMQGRSSTQQRDLVLKVLRSIVPSFFVKLMHFVLRPSKFTWEYYAFTTPFLFQWLVGPAEIRETEINGVKHKSVVHIKKCRFLESSNCVGMCVNLCKLPTEEFLNKDFGATVKMTPDFEDMSCQMVFGQPPLPISEDPAIKQPCYATKCITAQQKEGSCPKLNAIFGNDSLQRMKK